MATQFNAAQIVLVGLMLASRIRRKVILRLALLSLCVIPTVNAQNTISTIAGGGGLTKGPAASAVLPFPCGLARDSSGNVFIISQETAAAYRLNPKGQLNVVAGDGLQLDLGDGGPATKASMNLPSAIAVDVSGDLFIAQKANSAIRRVDAKTGIITTVAGNGTDGFGGDGGPATEAELGNPQGVAVDATGSILIADTSNNRIRKVDSVTGDINTIAGNGTGGFGGDGGPASSAILNTPQGLAFDAAGDLFFIDTGNYRVRRVDAKTGTITTVAGNGTRGFGGDGGPATSAMFNFIGFGVPPQVAIDAADNVYVADQFNQRIRRVDAKTGIITTVAGIFAQGFGGDGGPATSAELSDPSGILVDPSGNFYIGDNDNNRVRFVAGTTGIISTIAGNGGLGDGQSATNASLFFPHGVAVAGGNILIADSGNTLIRHVSAAGVIATISGQDYIFEYTGDGGPAVNATLNSPVGVTADASGNLFIADLNNNVIRRIDAASGVITTVAGTGTAGFTGDGGLATNASLNSPSAVALDTAENIFISDSNNERIRRVDFKSGVITTVAGNGTTGFSGDGGLAVNASLNLPFLAGGVAIDASRNLYISDTNNSRIRRVDSVTGVITTVAGSSSFCVSGKVGDGGPATSASLCFPEGLSIDPSGNIFIADTFGERVRRFDAASGTIATVAGNGLIGFSGDGGPAIAASLATICDVALDNAGNLYIVDSNNQRIRAVHLTPAATFTGQFMNFGPQRVGTTSPAQSLTLGNDGGQSLIFTAAIATGDFSASNTCSTQVPPAVSCTILVVFTPTQSGPRSGTLTVTTNDPTNPSQVFKLTGTATIGGNEILQITKNGSGAGTVTSSPSGINCGAACSANFASGTVVALTATESSGSTFSGWGDACTNATGTCMVTMNRSQTVTATFTAISSVGSPGPFAYVPIFGAGAVSVFDVSTNLPVATIPVGAGPVYTAVSPNGSFVYATNFDSGSVSVINSATNTVVASIPVGSQPFGVAITPDSSTVYVAVGGSSSNFVSVINAATQSVVETVSVGMSPGFVIVTPDGRYVYVSNGGSNSLSVIQVATNTVIATIPVGAAPQSVAVSPDGKDVYVVCPGSNVASVVDTASNAVVKSIPVSNGPYGISITPDGSTAYVAEYFGAATAVINLATGTVIATVPVGTNPRGSATTPDGASIWQTNLSSSFISVISTANNTVTASVPASSGVYNVAIAPAPPTSQSITQPLSPTAPNTFNYGPHNFTVTYPTGTSFSAVNMTVVAAQATQASIQQRLAGTQFANAACIVYSGSGGNCLDYQASCTNTSGNQITCPSTSSPTITVKTSFDTLQPITNPGFLTTPIGTNNWTNIFDSFFLQRIDPTMKGRTSGFSEFVAVDLGATNGQGAATFQFQAPLESKDQRIFPVGTSIPVSFQLTSIVNPRIPVTDAIAGITVVMVSPTTNLVLEQPAAFTYSGGNYTYSLNTTGYAPGTYNITVYGNAFVAQQVEFTLPAPTSGARISTTLQSLTLNKATNQYVAVFKMSNTGTGAANGLTVTASKLNSAVSLTSLPISMGDVNPASSVSVTLSFPASAGPPNSSGNITISESYAGGTSGGGFRVTLP